MDISYNLEQIKTKLLKMRFTTEKVYNTNDNIAIVGEDDRMEMLSSILELFRNKKPKIIKQLEKSELDKHLDELTELSYNKQWNYLSSIQKKKKLDEYINSIDPKYNIKELIDTLFKMDKLNSGTTVKYNKIEKKIQSITCIKFKKKEQEYYTTLKIKKKEEEKDDVLKVTKPSKTKTKTKTAKTTKTKTAKTTKTKTAKTQPSKTSKLLRQKK